MANYTTIQGQTWDQIALEAYGDEHKYEAIMDANPDYIDVLVFSAGTVLEIPEIEEETEAVSKDYPAWRAQLDG